MIDDLEKRVDHRKKREEPAAWRVTSGGRGRIGAIAALVVGIIGAGRAGAQTAAEVASANNPLAPVTSIKLQNYHISSLYGVPDQTANAMLLRPLVATTRVIIRGTLPVTTVPTGTTESVSGLGDFSAFGTFLLTSGEAKMQIGLGPLLVIPTASETELGDGKWQAGGALVGVIAPVPQVLLFTLVTYEHSFAGDEDRPDASLLTAQPGAIMQVGGGYYVRSTGVWQFDTETGDYSIPFGLGAGKVMRAGHAVLNLFVEPQFTMLHEGVGQPASQVFAGINVQVPGQ